MILSESTKRLLIYFVGLIGVSMVTLWISYYFFRPKIVYVNTVEVFNKFTYKDDLEEEFKKVQDKRKETIDSLMINMKYLSDEIDRNPALSKDKLKIFQQKRSQIQAIQDKYAEEEETIVASYQEKVWKRLEEYARQFGEEKGYDYVLGTSGNGTLIYAPKEVDVTRELIEYLNKNYKMTKSK